MLMCCAQFYFLLTPEQCALVKNENIILEDKIMADYVCTCMQVTEEQIKEAIANGAKTLDDIAEANGAGTGCGSCQSVIEEMLNA